MNKIGARYLQSKKKKKKNRNFGRIRRVIVRAGVGVNFREPPDEIGRVGISAKAYTVLDEQVCCMDTSHTTMIPISLLKAVQLTADSAGSTRKRTRLGVHSIFHTALVRLPVEPIELYTQRNSECGISIKIIVSVLQTGLKVWLSTWTISVFLLLLYCSSILM